MKMSIKELKNSSNWEKINISTPKFNIEKIIEETNKNPTWIHFGAGNIFRGFIGKIYQRLLNENLVNTGIIACDTFDYDIINKIYQENDNLTMLVNLKEDGTTENEVIGSIVKSYAVDTSNLNVMEDMIKIFENPSLQIVSFTVTEKGYALKVDNEYIPIVNTDINNKPCDSKHLISIVTYLLYKRYEKGKLPISLVSMDNCSHNGEKLQNAIIEIARNWVSNSFIDKEFIDYLSDENKVTFPWSMIDKITPRPSKSVEDNLTNLGIENMSPIVTSKNTFIAPFVNAEVPEYLVIEDKFPNGRPPLEQSGVYMTNRNTVNEAEVMKVTTCLNPLHTALSVYGCLLGYDRISEEMKNPLLRKLVENIGYHEGMKVVVDPKIISPKSFIDEVINKRLPNPFIPDEPQRIVTDTSQKVGIRFGKTIEAYIEREDLNVKDLTFIPLAIAGWFRYILAIDDKGNDIELSPDPLLDYLVDKLKTIEIGKEYNGELKDILENETIFGLNLVNCGLDEKIQDMFKELIKEVGSVEKTLEKYLV